ncbi:MAG: queuosine salvage family protein [Actinomycetota bacterium]
MSETIFDRVRRTCAAVAEVSTHVRIHEDAIEALADRLDLDRPPNDPGQEAIGDAESTAAFVLTLDAINFGSGYFPFLRKRPGHSGYHTVAASLRDWVAAEGTITTEALRAPPVDAWAVVFGQELDGSPAQELMELFTIALHDLADFVDSTADGHFVGVVENADGSAAALAESLTAMPFYRDVHLHPVAGEVHLYKRAQITAQDLAVAFAGEGFGRFDDLDQLTMFADNLVPHVLRVEGVLEFDDTLLARIEAVDDITIGSREEIEIRACGVTAVERLAAAVQTRANDPRPDLTTGSLDNILWNTGAEPAYKAIPRHRSRCVFY